MTVPPMSSGEPMRPRRHAGLDRSPSRRVVEHERHHLRLEGTRSDGVDRDVLADELAGQVAGQHVHAGLRRAVREVVGGRHGDAVDRADHDDPGGILGGSRRSRRREQRLGQEERRLDVEIHHLVEAGLGELVDRGTPGGAGVVDQDVHPILVLVDGTDETTHLVGVAQIGGDRDALAALQRVGRGIARLGLPGRDVDPHPVVDERLGDHESDPPRSAGHHGHLAAHTEEVLDRRHVITPPSAGSVIRVACYRSAPMHDRAVVPGPRDQGRNRETPMTETTTRLTNRVTELLGVRYPDRAGTDGLDRPIPVAPSAVSDAGGLGIIETSSGELDNVQNHGLIYFPSTH